MRDILSFCIKFMIIVSDSILTEDKLKHKNADFYWLVWIAWKRWDIVNLQRIHL